MLGVHSGSWAVRNCHCLPDISLKSCDLLLQFLAYARSPSSASFILWYVYFEVFEGIGFILTLVLMVSFSIGHHLLCGVYIPLQKF